MNGIERQCICEGTESKRAGRWHGCIIAACLLLPGLNFIPRRFLIVARDGLTVTGRGVRAKKKEEWG
jgi:hypothetical protein